MADARRKKKRGVAPRCAECGHVKSIHDTSIMYDGCAARGCCCPMFLSAAEDARRKAFDKTIKEALDAR